MTFERIVTMSPAYDKRSADPKKDYGIHGVDLRMVLKGEMGAVQFLLYTNWLLPHVTEERVRKLERADDVRMEVRCFWTPMPADLGYHSKTPHYEGQDALTKECEYLDGAPCYYDGSSTNAERIYEVLLHKGSDGVWRELEEYYAELFPAVSA